MTVNTERRRGACRPAEEEVSHAEQLVHRADLFMASVLKQLIAKGLTKTPRDGSQPEPHSGPLENPEADADHDCFVTLTAQPQSPSPEADYDKLLVGGKHCCHFFEMFPRCEHMKMIVTYVYSL